MSFPNPAGRATVIEDISFDIAPGEILGVVGESGCGKSVTALSIAGLVQSPGRFDRGRILFDGIDLLSLPEAEHRRIRGRRIAMIFQEPTTSLNPVFSVGRQIAEVFEAHLGVSRRESWDRAVEALRLVQIPAPERRAHDFPHQLSGGMRQRVMIAIALACRPSLLIADEPTTALDVTVQAQIITLMRRLRAELGTAILFISHDLALVADFADRVAVAYAGQIIEEGAARAVFAAPRHPYTQALLRAMPLLGERVRHGRKPLAEIPGSVPRPTERITGCRFRARCAQAMPACAEDHALFHGALQNGVRCLLHAMVPA